MEKQKKIPLLIEEAEVALKKSIEDDQKRSAVRENIIAIASGRNPFQENPLKSLTVRLSCADYAKLSVLSSRLNQSPSGLAKILLVDALSDGIRAYLSVKNNVDEFAGESLAEDIREEELRIFEDLSL